MKVLQQLVQHFWQRGALTLDQAHYLVEHGFVRAEDLESYEARPGDEGDDGADDDFPPAEVLLPDEMDRKEEELSDPAAVRRKGARATPKLPDLTSEQLGERLEDVLRAREPWLAALPEVAGLPGLDERRAAVVLRQVPDEEFRRRLLAAVQTRPGALADLWECVDVKPFHDLLDQPGVKGRPARAFGLVLRAADAADFAPVAWILRVPAVQTVANLLAVRRRLLAAVSWLYENRWARLARCLQRPARPAPSWDGLAFGLVLVFNARAARRDKPAGSPVGYPAPRRLDADGWREAWTAAMSLGGAAMTPFFIRWFSGLGELTESKLDHFAGREDLALICPHDWKV